jgi:hypothetical protein
MVAKFQTLMCFFAKTESSPNSSKRLFTFICTLSPTNLKGDHCVKIVKWQAHLLLSFLGEEKIVPDWSKISNIVLFFIDIRVHAYIKLHDIIYISVKQQVYREHNISK